jgi:hypothetical protein
MALVAAPEYEGGSGAAFRRQEKRMKSLLLPLFPLLLAAGLAGCTTYHTPVGAPTTVVVPGSEAQAEVQHYPLIAAEYPAYPYAYSYPYGYAYPYAYYPYWYGSFWFGSTCCFGGKHHHHGHKHAHGHKHGHGHAHGGKWGGARGTAMGAQGSRGGGGRGGGGGGGGGRGGRGR